MTAGIAYTIATGRLFCPVAEFHAEAERLLGHPIFTHEFADPDVWTALRDALEEEFVAVLSPIGSAEISDE